MENSRILVIDDDGLVQKMILDCLSRDGYVVLQARNCQEAEVQLQDDLPDMVLLDVVMPDRNGFDFLRQLRNNTRTSHLPVIMLTSRTGIEDKVLGLDLGADDYVTKPFEPLELLARVKTNIRRAKQINHYNPLTGLPGNILIEEKMEELIQRQIPFSICYVDLDNFKVYNDIYGFVKGDEVIKMVARIIKVSTEKQGNCDDFVGHIGGDDYVLFTSPDKVDAICQDIIDRFDAVVPLFYETSHRQKGFVTSLDREGKKRKFLLLTISIAVVDCQGGAFKSAIEVAEKAAFTKNLAKESLHSNYIRYTGG